MPRNVPASLEGRLNAQVTATGYLLQITTPARKVAARSAAVLRLCDIGTIANPVGTWTHEDFDIKGAGTENVTLSIQNVNNAIGAFVLNAQALGDVAFLLWQIERGDADHPVSLGDYRAANAKIGLDKCDFALRQTNLQYRFSPSRRINLREGFKFALRPGEIFLWGSQRIIVGERN
jgi:hypothetical protein